MKNCIHKLSLILMGLLVLSSCKKDATLTYWDVVNFPPSLTASATDITLTSANADNEAIAFEWPAVTFKIEAPVTYKLQVDLPADTIGTNAWANAIEVEAGTDLYHKSLSQAELNEIVTTQLGLPPNESNNVVTRTVAVLDRNVFSNAVAYKVKPYKVVVQHALYVPGEYQGWDPANSKLIGEVDGKPGMYEGYVYMPGTGTKYFKYTNAPDWNHTNYGNGGSGSFNTDGAAAGLSVPDGGYYYLTADLNTQKWTATKTTWSIIGDATPGGWGTDTQMTYDEAKGVWKVTADMKSGGSFKFRANNGWQLDFGMDPSTGDIKYADNPFLGYTPDLWNLSVPSDGNYTITLDLSNTQHYTYKVVKN